MLQGQKKILAICGSTRKTSVNLHILQALPHIYPLNAVWEIYTDLAELPHFNADTTEDMVSHSVSQFRQLIASADGVVICSPEYVFSVPGSLKNALEWLVASTVFSNKPTCIITAATSGLKAHEQLVLIMQTIGSLTTPATSLLIQAPKTKINIAGEVIDAPTKVALEALLKAFEVLLQQE